MCMSLGSNKSSTRYESGRSNFFPKTNLLFGLEIPWVRAIVNHRSIFVFSMEVYRDSIKNSQTFNLVFHGIDHK